MKFVRRVLDIMFFEGNKILFLLLFYILVNNLIFNLFLFFIFFIELIKLLWILDIKKKSFGNYVFLSDKYYCLVII